MAKCTGVAGPGGEMDETRGIKSENRVTSIPKIRPKNKLIIADKLAREIIPTLLILTFSK